MKKNNLTQTTYGRYELNKNEPDIATLVKIADLYQVSVDYLIEHDTGLLEDFGPLTEAQKMAISILMQLQESDFYEYLGRLKMSAEINNINYKGK